MSRVRYTGGGQGGFLPDIPARDLNEDEVERWGLEFLLATGLYEEENDGATDCGDPAGTEHQLCG